MLAFRRILVAVKDLQARSRPAVRKAAQLAKACHAQVELYHCLSTPVYTDLALDGARGLKDMERDAREYALRRLERIAAGVRRHGVKASVAAEWDFPTYDAIVRRARHIKGFAPNGGVYQS